MKVKASQILILIHILFLAAVVGPFLVFGELSEDLTIELMSGERSLEIFLVTAGLLAADVFVPIPSSVISVSAALLLGPIMSFWACLLGLTGSCFIGYGFGFYFRKVHFDRWYTDGEFRHLSSELSRFGYVVLLMCRGIPLLAEMSVIVAGFHRYSLRKFTLVTLAGNTILAAIYSLIGNSVTNYTPIYLIVAAFLIIPLVAYLLRLWWLKRIETPAAS